MSIKHHTNKGTVPKGVNPQGYAADDDSMTDPKSKLENAAKKKNTK